MSSTLWLILAAHVSGLVVGGCCAWVMRAHAGLKAQPLTSPLQPSLEQPDDYQRGYLQGLDDYEAGVVKILGAEYARERETLVEYADRLDRELLSERDGHIKTASERVKPE